MIVNTNNVEVVTNQSTTEFELDNSNGQLFAVLSELYSKPVESTIREICTNCTDAHILSNNQVRPFVVKLPNYEKNIMNISFRDYGPGLKHQEVMSIYKVYGKSTKTKSNDVTGCLGLGSKSPYSISSTFYVRSYNNGKMSLYVCTMGNNGRPNITDEPVVVDTHEENGLEVIIPFYKEVDFISILKHTLKYFKVKPLVYIQQSELEQDTLVDMDWVPTVECEKLTDTIYLPKNGHKLEDFCSYLNTGRSIISPEVIQLQIYYPLDYKIIMETIERYNKLYTNEFNQMVKGYKIDNDIIKTIKYLFNIGFQFYAKPGMIAFSPSREYIKYTDITLMYIIKELIKAAKIINKQVDSQYGLINSKEQVFDKLIGRNNKYSLLKRYFNLVNPQVSRMMHEFDKDIPLNRMVGYTNKVSLYGEKIKRYPANFIMNYMNGSDTINVKHLSWVEELINRKVCALDCYDTSGRMVGQNDGAIMFCTYTNQMELFVREHINKYISFLVNNIFTSLSEALTELCYKETEGAILSSGGIIDGINVLKWFGIDIKERFKNVDAVGIDRDLLFQDLKDKIIDIGFFKIFSYFNEKKVKSDFKSFITSAKNPYSSKYVVKMFDAANGVNHLDIVYKSLTGDEVNKRVFNFKFGDEKTITLTQKLIKNFMIKLSPYFIKFAHAHDANPSRFLKRVKACSTDLNFKEKIWSFFARVDSDNIKEVNEVFLSGSILKIKILKHEICNNLVLFETLMLDLLLNNFEVFKNQNLLGKVDKFKLYYEELTSFQIPTKYCTLKDFETMVLVKVGATGKRVNRSELNLAYRNTFLYTWDEVPSIDSIVDLTLAANNLLTEIKQAYKVHLKETYIRYQRELRLTKTHENYMEILKKYGETFKNGLNPATIFGHILNNLRLTPENNGKNNVYFDDTWDKIQVLLKNKRYTLEQTWENHNHLITICRVLRKIYTELKKKNNLGWLEKYPSIASNSFVLNNHEHYTIDQDDKMKYRGGIGYKISSFKVDANTWYYTKPEGIKSIVMMKESSKFSVAEKRNEANLDELLSNHKVSILLTGTNQKLGLGNKAVFNNPDFIAEEKLLTETMLRDTKKYIKDTLYGDKLISYLCLFDTPKEYIYIQGMDHLFTNRQLKETYNVLKICLETLFDTTYNTIYELPANIEYVYSDKVWNWNQHIPALKMHDLIEILTSKGYSKDTLKEMSGSVWPLLLQFVTKEDAINKFKKDKDFLGLDKEIKSKYLEFAGEIFDKARKDINPMAKISKLDVKENTDMETLLHEISYSYSSFVSDKINAFIQFRRDMRNSINSLKVYEKLPEIPSRNETGNRIIKDKYRDIIRFIDDLNSLRQNYKEIPDSLTAMLQIVNDFKSGYVDRKESVKIKKFKGFEDLIKKAIKHKNNSTVNKRINLREEINKRKEKGLNAKTNLQLRKCGVF